MGIQPENPLAVRRGQLESPMPTFTDHIQGVVQHGPEEEVIGPDTQWSVALVQNPHSRRNRAHKQLVGYPMRLFDSPVYAQMTIPVAGYSAGPKPAVTIGPLPRRLVDFRRETTPQGAKHVVVRRPREHLTTRPTVSVFGLHPL